jgi:hypothetical protein
MVGFYDYERFGGWFDGLMVGIVMLRGLCCWVFSTKSFKHLALDLTFGKNGTLIRE